MRTPSSKAQSLFDASIEMVLADDSGLEIDFLTGAPVFITSRFAGDGASQLEKNTKILHLLKGIDEEYRTARFVCAIAFVSKDTKFTVEASVEGRISECQEGDAGFGYDPIFYVPEYRQTFGQLPDKIKNEISHRALALKKLRKELAKMITG